MLSGCVTTENGVPKDLLELQRNFEEAPVEEFTEVAMRFIQAGREGDLETLLSLTSDVTKRKEDMEAFYTEDLIPSFKKIEEVYSGGSHQFVSKSQSKTGPGWSMIKTVRTADKEVSLRIVVLREKGKVVVTSVGPA